MSRIKDRTLEEVRLDHGDDPIDRHPASDKRRKQLAEIKARNEAKADQWAKIVKAQSDLGQIYLSLKLKCVEIQTAVRQFVAHFAPPSDQKSQDEVASALVVELQTGVRSPNVHQSIRGDSRVAELSRQYHQLVSRRHALELWLTSIDAEELADRPA